MSNDGTNAEWRGSPREKGVVRAICEVPGNFLAEGRHFLLAAVSTLKPTKAHVIERDAVAFQVVDRTSGDGVRGEYVNEWPGAVRPMLKWRVSSQAKAQAELAAGTVTEHEPVGLSNLEKMPKDGP